MGMNTITMLENSDGTSGLDKKWKGLDGKGLVYAEGGAGVGQSYNREAAAALPAVPGTGTPGSFTWASGSRPTKIKISLMNATSPATYLWVVFDAPDAATANTWIQGATGVAVDSQRFVALPTTQATGVNLPFGNTQTEFSFTSGLSNMYYILQAADNTTILHVEAS